MQKKITLNQTEIKQPDEGLSFDFETTYSEDSGRTLDGVMHASPVFTVESYGYSASFLTKTEMKTILQIIANGSPFSLHRFSPYYGEWREDPFYVGKGSLVIGSLTEDRERFTSLSFNMIGVNPI